MEAIAESCLHLKEISLNDSYTISDLSVLALAAGCTELRYVSLAHCAITDASVQKLARSARRLRYLNVHDCRDVTDASVTQLALRCKRLRHLDVGKCSGVTNASLACVARQLSIRRLSLKDCACVNDVGLRALATHARKLRYLNVQGCTFSFDTYVYLRTRCSGCVIEHDRFDFSS